MTRLARGFSLIDVIVGVALMLVVFMSLFGILRASLILSAFTKAKATATELANTQVEYLRGISYDILGTIGGIPTGAVPQFATSTVDGVPYVLHTYVEYYDDPADGTGVNDTNHITTDYKKGKMTVSYSINGLPKTVVLFSNFVPPGIETATNGGTLSLHVVDATGANMSNATVQIVNTATIPTINFATFTDLNGLVTADGAATSSQYQIQVSRSGYSSAQTYLRDAAANANPTPGYLTVVKNQTTSSTFAIDQFATLLLSSFSPATTKSFSDAFTSAAKLARQTNTTASGGALTLTSQMLSGSALSTAITPNSLTGWGILSATIATTTETTIVIHVDDASGTPLPDAVLTGNSAGFSSFPISLTGVATSSYPTLALEASLTSTATTSTPSLSTWSLSYTEGVAPLPNVAFTLTGTKTIGTTILNAPIYKTVLTDTTGAAAKKSESLEWDSYKLTLSTLPLLESCTPSPYSLPPAVATTTALLTGTLTTNTLPVVVEDTAKNPIGTAKVLLTTAGYAATIPTSSCGLAYFNGLAAATYTATVSAPGHATTTFPAIVVGGRTATKTVTLP